jgi:phage terminase large subunit
VDHNFRVRWYQQCFHKALVNRTHDRLLAVWHRRAGKDEIVLNGMRELALKDPGTYWHCFPEQKQARKAIWNGVDGHTGKRRIFQAFPEPIIKRMQDDDMFIEMHNGATFQLIGSDRYDSTVGSGPKGIAYSEWALSNPAAWAYHAPMIRETKGFAAFITTPRGRNHVHTMLKRAQTSKDWFWEVLSIKDTEALTQAQLKEALEEYRDLYGEDMGNAFYEQEYLCSFNAAILGAFYAREMLAVRESGRITEIDFDPSQEVHTAWDIGVNDDTSIWWFQVRGGQVFVYDCYSANAAGVDHYAEVCRKKAAEYGWTQGVDFVPHDAEVMEWGTGRTRVESMLREKLKPRVVALHSKLDGIQAVRLTLKKTIFHSRCEDLGVAALEQYRREWDDEKKTFKPTEYRDWTTHLSDAFRYLAMSWRVAPSKPAIEKPKLKTGQVILPGPPMPTRTNRIKIG